MVVLVFLLAQPDEQKLASALSRSSAKDAEPGTFCGAEGRANPFKYQNSAFHVATTN